MKRAPEKPARDAPIGADERTSGVPIFRIPAAQTGTGAPASPASEPLIVTSSASGWSRVEKRLGNLRELEIHEKHDGVSPGPCWTIAVSVGAIGQRRVRHGDLAREFLPAALGRVGERRAQKRRELRPRQGRDFEGVHRAAAEALVRARGERQTGRRKAVEGEARLMSTSGTRRSAFPGAGRSPRPRGPRRGRGASRPDRGSRRPTGAPWRNRDSLRSRTSPAWAS